MQSLSDAGSSSSFFAGAEEEANNYLEEVTHQIQQRQQRSPLSMLSTPTRGHHLQMAAVAAAVDSLGAIGDSLTDDSLVLDRDSLKQAAAEGQKATFLQPDSLSFDEDTFVKQHAAHAAAAGGDDFYDSISSSNKETGHGTVSAAAGNRHSKPAKKKLIIPYTDSYSSNTSVFTSQEDDDDDDDDDEVSLGDDDDDDEDEEASRGRLSELALDIRPLKSPPSHSVSLRRPVSASPAIPTAGPGRILPNPNVFAARSRQLQHHGSNPDLAGRFSTSVGGNNPAILASTPPNLNATLGPMPFPAKRNLTPEQAVSPQQQSLMRIATERMKRKILGWN